MYDLNQIKKFAKDHDDLCFGKSETEIIEIMNDVFMKQIGIIPSFDIESLKI